MIIEEASKKTFDFYIKLLKDRKIKSRDCTKDVDKSNTLSLEHALFMCEYCSKAIDIKNKKSSMSVDKYSRWLGYIQAILIMHKITTVETERNRTRPWFTKNMEKQND